MYVCLLLKEVLMANIHVAKIVLTPKLDIDPVVVNFKTKLKTEKTKAMLANSITLTPGTITMLLEGNVYTVHCLKKEFAKNLENSNFENILLKIEEK